LNKWIITIIFSTLFLILLSVPEAQAEPFFLTDGNSIVAISIESQLGTFFWAVDDDNQIFQQWFWFRIGDDGPEKSLNRLKLVNNSTTTNTLTANFTNGDLQIDVVWELKGNTPSIGFATLNEKIVITNTGVSQDPMEMHFFQYTDFDVGGPQNNIVEIIPPNIAIQKNGPIAETVVSPDPSHFQVGRITEDDNMILRSLNDDLATTLNDTAGPIPMPGEDGVDGNWAFQWDVDIDRKKSFTILKTKTISPQPGGNGSPTSEPPTIGPDRKGVVKVNDGICINISCWTVTRDYHVDFELYEMLTGKNTISLEILCPQGVADCNYTAIGITPPLQNINSAIWNVAITKDHLGEWSLQVSDPGGYLGEITYTTQQIDNYRLGVSFTIDFMNKAIDKAWLWVQLRDFSNGVRNFYFNEGIKFVDVDGYPSVITVYEKPIKVEPLCINEDPSQRNSCAFEKVRDWTTKSAQKILDDILDGNYVYDRYYQKNN